MNTYPLWQYAHILLFVYWLGADLGVSVASRYVARADLPLDERLRFLELLLKVDMGPRMAERMTLAWLVKNGPSVSVMRMDGQPMDEA